MKKLALSVLLVIFFQLIFSQSNENRDHLFFTRIGLNTLNEINLYYHPGKKKDNQLSLGIGYKFGSKIFDHCGLIDPRGFRLESDKKGIIGRIGLDKRFEDEYQIFRFAVYAEGRLTKVNRFIVDEGCYSGSRTGGKYEEYDVDSKEFYLRLYLDRPSKNGFSNFYWSLGGGRRYVTKSYLIYGRTYADRMPSDRIDEGWEWIFLVDMGFRFGMGTKNK